jgi:hypothetical protein
LRVVCLLTVLAPALIAQSGGALRGRVADESGAVVPAATVALRGPASYRATTDETGAYAFANVIPGNYTVQAAAPSLAQSPVKIAIKPGVQTLDLLLRVASMNEKLTVQENAGPSVSLDAASNASAIVLRGADLDALSDDPDDLAADLAALAGPAAGPSGGAIFVDGFSGGELPPKNSIREIRINQNPFSPEYDKLGYGRIEIFTKPGAGKYRGTVDYNFANDFWNSRNPYSARKAPFLLDEFEGNAGGPITRRSSFTLDAQRNMVDNGSISNAVTVDPATLAIQPFSSVLTTPGRFFKVTPRLDYQLSANHTLMFRYGVTHSDVRDNGIGAFDLVSRGYHSQFTNQTVQAGETAVIGTAVNETRFQYYRSATQSIANSNAPAVLVLGSFYDGGSTVGRSFDTQNSYEFQNYTSLVRGTHSWRFGVRLRGQTDDSVSPQNFNGTFTFGGIDRYRLTLQGEQLGDSPARIRALGGGATQFSITAGQPEVAAGQADAALFAGDEWRMRPNMTLSLGLRYEVQTNIHDANDWAPRVALAWSPGMRKNAKPKTVVRAGVGMFYDRFPLANTLTAARHNGIVQQQYVVSNPDFFPAVPAISTLAGLQTAQIVERVSSQLRAPYIIQTAISVERQLPANTTLAITFTDSHGLHLLRSAVLPGPVFLMESPGLYNQTQAVANVNSKVNAAITLFGFYVWNQARSNTDGAGTFPANPRDWSGEYGRASTDVRHRIAAGGSVNLRWSVRFSALATVQSGAPFNITTGSDLYGTTLFNARPAFATDPTKPGLIATSYGLLDPNPSPGEPLLPRNYGRGPAQIVVNLRLAKSIGFGSERGAPAPQTGAGLTPAVGGGGLRGIIGSPTTPRRYNVTIAMSVRNLLNHTNAGPIVGNITSPLFGFSNQVSGSPNGEGFYETANNRRLEMQCRFTF